MKGMILTLALLTFIAQAAAQQPNGTASYDLSKAPVATTDAIVIDMAKQPADVKAAQELLEARALAWQRLVQSIMSQPGVQKEQQALQQAEADRDAKLLKAAGKDAKAFTVEATAAGLRIVARPNEAGK